MLAFKPLQLAVVFFLCLAAFDAGLYVWASSTSFGIANENGAIENIQVLVLGLSFVTYILIFSKQGGAAQTLAGVFCFLCFFMILKELSFKELEYMELDYIGPTVVPHWVDNVLAEQLRKILQWLNLLLLIVFLISRMRDISSLVRAMISRPAWPFYLSFALLVLSQVLEHEGFRDPGGLTGPELHSALADFHRSLSIAKFWEELIEINAFLILLYAALTTAVISSLVNVGGKKMSGRFTSTTEKW